jgi:hypothetical protein
MFDEAALLEKLLKIEALHAGATTDGERVAAAYAADRIRERLAVWRAREPDVEMRYSLHDPWSRKLFIALCRRYGLQPFRRPRQHRSTLCVKAPASFQDNSLWIQFKSLNEALHAHLNAITERVIRTAVHEDSSDAPEVADPKQLADP